MPKARPNVVTDGTAYELRETRSGEISQRLIVHFLGALAGLRGPILERGIAPLLKNPPDFGNFYKKATCPDGFTEYLQINTFATPNFHKERDIPSTVFQQTVVPLA